MVKEIGSEFWDVPIKHENNFEYKNFKWFESGRSALGYLLNAINIKSVALPSFCCDSMIKPFVDRNIYVTFYPVYVEDKRLIQEYDFSKDAILVLDYFGYTTKEISLEYKGIIIRDVTHSYFSHVYNDADYYFGSFRKWFGVVTGGYLFSNKHNLPQLELSINEKYSIIRKNAMNEKRNYINGIIMNKDYLLKFSEYEEYLEKSNVIHSALIEDINSLKKLDIVFIKNRRRENAKIIMEKFSDYCLFTELSKDDCPLFVPIILKNNRDNIRSYLVERDIYCPIHWPMSQYHRLDESTKKIYEQELSLICDHRYSCKEIKFMCDILEEAMKLFYIK